MHYDFYLYAETALKNLNIADKKDYVLANP